MTQLSSVMAPLKTPADDTLNELSNFSALWNQVCMSVSVYIQVIVVVELH